MKGLAINTENLMRFKDFKEPALESLQKEVGGCIEVVHPKYLPQGFCMVVNDEGLLMGLPPQPLLQRPLWYTGTRPAHCRQRRDP